MCDNSGMFDLTPFANQSDLNTDENPWAKILYELRLEQEYKRYCLYYQMELNQKNIAGFIIWKKLGMKI